MNKIKTMMMAVVAFCAASITSCTDKMEWTVDPEYDRLFSILSCDVTPDATSITLDFKAPKGADGYQIQWSTSAISDDVEDAPGNMVVTSSPAVIEGLMGDTEYFIRIRAISDSKKCSKWIRPCKSDGSFYKTLKEQIMNTVLEEDRSQDAIRVTWKPGMEVTHLIVTDADGNETRVDIDANAKAAGEMVVTGLQPLTSYTFAIYNGEAMRGSCSAATTAAAPKGDYTYYMPQTMTVLDNETMRMISDEAKAKASDPSNYTATIVIPAGTTVDLVGKSESGDPASLKIPEGMSVTFFGAAGEKPTVNLSKSIDLGGSHAFVRFQDLNIEDGGCQYVFNQSAACAVEDLSFTNINFNFNPSSRSVVRAQGSNAVNISSISLDNCTINNLADNYYAFDLRGSNQSIGKFTMTNSTAFNVARFFQNTGNDMTGGVNISDCTFQDVIASGRYFIDCNGKTSNVNLERIVIGTVKTGGRGVRTNGTVAASGFRTKDSAFASNDFKSEVGFPADEELTAADIFVDAANGNLTLKISDKVGDPRWYKAAE